MQEHVPRGARSPGPESGICGRIGSAAGRAHLRHGRAKGCRMLAAALLRSEGLAWVQLLRHACIAGHPIPYAGTYKG